MKIILDACCNHLGNEDIINEMISIASKHADYIKFQLYDFRTLNFEYPNFHSKYKEYKQNEIDEYKLDFIFNKCAYYGITPMFTIFNLSRLEYLEKYSNVSFALKVASPNARDIEFIRNIYKQFPGKPLLVSTGMVGEDRIQKLQDLKKKMPSIKLLYCISKYPTPIEEINFKYMLKFDGFSDHTLGFETSLEVGKYELEYYERHFTLSRNLPGKDHKISVIPEDLERLVQNLRFKENLKNYIKRWDAQ